MRYLTIVAALALGTAAASPAAALQPPVAAAPTAAPAAAEPLLIPFKPPLGRPLRYRMSRNGDTGESLVTAVTFAEADGAYRLTAAVELPPNLPAHPALALLRKPMVFALDAAGAITAMADEQKWMDESEQLARSLAVAGPEGERAVEAMIGRIRAMPPQARLELFSRNHQPITEFAASDMAPGETRRAGIASETLLGSVEQDIAITLDGVEGGRARFLLVQRLPPEQMAAMFDNLRQTLGGLPGLDEAARGKISGERRNLFEVDTATGLTTRMVSTITITGAPGGSISREIMRLERIAG